MLPFKGIKITCLKPEKKRYDEGVQVNCSMDIIEDCYREKH